MKKAIVFLTCLISTHYAIAECSNNRNTDIIINKPDSRYTDNMDGTVTDKHTNLMWQKCSLGQTWNSTSNGCDGTASKSNWPDALQAAIDNTDYSYNDWYLPNAKELQSLSEYACFGPAINDSLFPNTDTGIYWSSSVYSASANSREAFGVNANNGFMSMVQKNATQAIRLVRVNQ